MIPTIWPVALAGGALVRWRAVPIAAAAWAGLLLIAGTIGISEVPLTLAIAAANAVPFALIGWAIRERSLVRRDLQTRS